MFLGLFTERRDGWSPNSQKSIFLQDPLNLGVLFSLKHRFLSFYLSWRTLLYGKIKNEPQWISGPFGFGMWDPSKYFGPRGKMRWKQKLSDQICRGWNIQFQAIPSLCSQHKAYWGRRGIKMGIVLVARRPCIYEWWSFLFFFLLWLANSVWGTSPRNCFLGSLPVFLNSSWCELILPNSELYSSGCFFSNWIFKVKSFRSLFESFTPPAPNFIFVQKLSSLLVALTYSSDRQSCLGRRFTLMTKFPKCPARGLLPFLTYCTSISSSRRSQGGKWARRIG